MKSVERNPGAQKTAAVGLPQKCGLRVGRFNWVQWRLFSQLSTVWALICPTNMQDRKLQAAASGRGLGKAECPYNLIRVRVSWFFGKGGI